MMKFEWEVLYSDSDSSSGERITRAKVYGGWIVKNLTWHEHLYEEQSGVQSESMVFIADPNHEWTIE